MATRNGGAKNFALTPAASDLGLGDLVKQQLEDDEEERKKKLLAASKRANSPFGPATQALMSGGIGG